MYVLFVVVVVVGDNVLCIDVIVLIFTDTKDIKDHSTTVLVQIFGVLRNN
jgi:hypothetical protein